MHDDKNLNAITDKIIGSAINVHRELGPGLLESAYEACLVHDLMGTGLKVEQQKSLPVIYKDVKLDCGYRLDLMVDDEVIVEIKSVEKLIPVHSAQLLSYLKLSGCSVGLLVNFNVEILKSGIKRIVNNFPDSQRTQRTLRSQR
jgi:GxxExxY protein